MELGDIIKWVDRKNQDLRNAEFNQIFMEDNPQEEIILERVREYNPEYDKYSYALIPHILQLSEDNKKALIKRLFRNSSSFFHRCEQNRKCTDDYVWVFSMQNNIIYFNCDDEDLFINPSAGEMMALEYELLGFYSEIIQLCVECGLNLNELHNSDIKNEVIEDIVKCTRLTPQEKYEAQKSLLPTKWQDYIIGPEKTQWEQLIANDISKARNRNGRLVATIITAMQKKGAIIHLGNRSEFYRYLKADFPNLNKDTAINNPLNGNSNLITQQEIEKVLKRLENYE